MPKIGKRKKLQIARQLPCIKEDAEDAEDVENEDDYLFDQIEQTCPFENCIEELYEKYNDAENFPLFCYLEKKHLRDFLRFIL